MAQTSPHNPIPEILELIPYSESVLDPKLLDSIRETIKGVRVSDSYIILLLSHLTDARLVTLTNLEHVSALGTMYFIKRELNGN